MSDGTGESYEFGPFQVDLGERELWRGDQLIPLTAKSFDLLLILIRQTGHTVTRSELFASLWPDAVVEDSNLTQTVSMLRKALAENGETDASGYIVTVPKRGYKFVGPVSVRAGGTGGDPEAEVQPEGRPEAKVRPPSQLRFHLNYPVAAVVAGALLLVLAGGAAYSRFHVHAKPLTDQDVLVLADFTNTTGDTVFDGALRQALAFELEQSPFLKIMDDEEVSQTLQLMGLPASQSINDDIAHEVCVRQGQKATLGGSIASLGKTYQIGLQALNCQTGATLAREQAVAEDKEHVLKALAKAI
jgi:DNA-binding winged helix-turn-helix (wHTH) protein